MSVLFNNGFDAVIDLAVALSAPAPAVRKISDQGRTNQRDWYLDSSKPLAYCSSTLFGLWSCCTQRH